jgi:protein SCO1/2
MAGRSSLRAAALALAALALAACRASSAGTARELSSSFVPIPNVELVTQAGEHLSFYDDLVRGRVVVVQFFFVHCEGVCPRSTGKMLELQEALGPRLGREISFLSITLDPERDTPAVLAEHARTIGANPGWTFLTGSEADTEALRRRLGVFDLDPGIDADRNQHAGVLVLGNDRKQRWTMKPATLSAASLMRALERLAGEPLD